MERSSALGASLGLGCHLLVRGTPVHPRTRRGRNVGVQARRSSGRRRRPPVPGAAFHDLLCCPIRCWMSRHFFVEDFSVGVPNHEEGREAFGTGPFGTGPFGHRNRKPKSPARDALGTLANRARAPVVLGAPPAPTMQNSARGADHCGTCAARDEAHWR
jgi:hypothetical protein